MKRRKGILLAGGSGTRLFPLTKYVCKQLLPLYDKPLIWYPLFSLMHAGIREILVISTPETTPVLERQLGDGSDFGARFEYKVQETPNGLAQAFVLGRDFVGKDDCCLMLGDNVFYGNGFAEAFRRAAEGDRNVVFGYRVADPRRYGVAELDADGRVLSIEEKPERPKSEWAVPGAYFYGNDVLDVAAGLKPSARGEYEITDVNMEYVRRGGLWLEKIGVGNAWLDCGTFQSLNDASNFIRTIQERTGVSVCDITQFGKNQRFRN